MKPIVLLTTLLMVMNAAFGEEKPEAQKPASKVEMLIPGIIQPGQPKIQSGETWWGLCETEVGAFELVQTTVTINTATYWRTNTDVRNVITGVNREFLFLVRGSSLFEEGLVETDYDCIWKKFLPGEEIQVRRFTKDPKIFFYIFAAGRLVNRDVLENYSINISSNVRKEETVQKILELEKISLPNGTPRIVWAGDVDRDGKLDIFLKTHLGPGSDLILFLSSEAQEGEIVHKVAEIPAQE